MTSNIVIFSTAPDETEARKIARTLVEHRLAACVNIVPGVQSVYRWKGAIEQSHEYLLIIKTRQELFGELRDSLKAVHPYEVPEAVAIRIEDGLPAYLEWINAETTPA